MVSQAKIASQCKKAITQIEFVAPAKVKIGKPLCDSARTIKTGSVVQTFNSSRTPQHRVCGPCLPWLNWPIIMTIGDPTGMVRDGRDVRIYGAGSPWLGQTALSAWSTKTSMLPP